MTDDEVPPLLPPGQMPPIIDQATLHRTWRAFMGELGFADRQLWVLFIEADGRPIHVIKVEQLPPRPMPDELCGMTSMLSEIVRDSTGVRVAFLFARPGRGPRRSDDLAWASALARASREADLGALPVHLADADSVSVVAPDDLADAV